MTRGGRSSSEATNERWKGSEIVSKAAEHKGSEDAGGIAKEQLLTDLDQTIGDREQALADHEQSRLDSAQTELDDERLVAAAPSLSDDVKFDQRQGELDRAEARRDIHQAQLDATQIGRDDRQDLLDTQQDAAPPVPGATLIDIHALRQAAESRAQHARQRAQAARARAVEAELRADHAERRAAEAPQREA
jgi:hypothetical protein